ncbi:flagellar basal body protein [Achromobacter insuavis]
MNGAARITEHQAALSNNMANVNTPGFREQIALYRSVPVNDGVSLPTRVSTVASTPRNNFEMGNMQTTAATWTWPWPAPTAGSPCRPRKARPTPAPAACRWA